MCVSAIIKRYESVPDEEGPEFGWKIFEEVQSDRQHLYARAYFGLYTGWTDYKDKSRKVLAGIFFEYPWIRETTIIDAYYYNPAWKMDALRAPNGYYPGGFHVFCHYEDAKSRLSNLHHPNGRYDYRKLEIRKVSYWGRVAYGHDGHADVVIVRNMLVHTVDQTLLDAGIELPRLCASRT